MAALHVLLSLTILLQVGVQQAGSHNPEPCEPNDRDDPYKTFFNHHIRSGLPNTLDQNQWSDYMGNHMTPYRPIQSFFRTDQEHLVKAVCSPDGGFILRKNLCISRNNFTFRTVENQGNQSHPSWSVTEETKHLILACDKVDNQCLPVHFEPNKKNIKPDQNTRGCE